MRALRWCYARYAMKTVRWCCALPALFACTFSSARAQDTPPTAWARSFDANAVTSATRVNWLGAWSPLRPIADIARGELRAPFGPGLTEAPAPIAGIFFLTGAPSALARDITTTSGDTTASFSEIRIQRASQSGAFHRPFDAVRSDAMQVSGFGWAPVGARGVAMGRVIIDQESQDTSSLTQRIAPAWSSPFVAADSVRPPMVLTRARAEGVLGLRLGEYSIGVAGALDARDGNSVDFPLRRTGRWSVPAATLSAERRLPWLAARVGAYRRWSESAETNVLNPSPLNTVIYAVQGLDEPQGIPVVNANLFVRSDRRATASGVTTAFTLYGTQVAAAYERGNRADDQYRLITARVRPTDAWRTSASDMRVQLVRTFGERVRAMLVASHSGQNGFGNRSDLAGRAVDGRDEQTAVEADVRTRVGTFSVGVTGGVVQQQTTRVDYVAELTSDIQQSTPFASVEIARPFGAFTIAAGGSVAATSPTASLPPATRGPNYQKLIAPALAYDAAETTAMAFWFSARRALRGHEAFVSIRSETVSPNSALESRLQPDGTRSRLQVSIGYRP